MPLAWHLSMAAGAPNSPVQQKSHKSTPMFCKKAAPQTVPFYDCFKSKFLERFYQLRVRFCDKNMGMTVSKPDKIPESQAAGWQASGPERSSTINRSL